MVHVLQRIENGALVYLFRTATLFPAWVSIPAKIFSLQDQRNHPYLPGLWNTPVASRPQGRPTQPTAGFVARLSSDGVTLSPTELLPVVVNGPFSNTLAVRNDGSAIVVPATGCGQLIRSARVASITDTDNTRLVASRQDNFSRYGERRLRRCRSPSTGSPRRFCTPAAIR